MCAHAKKMPFLPKKFKNFYFFEKKSYENLAKYNALRYIRRYKESRKWNHD